MRNKSTLSGASFHVTADMSLEAFFVSLGLARLEDSIAHVSALDWVGCSARHGHAWVAVEVGVEISANLLERSEGILDG